MWEDDDYDCQLMTELAMIPTCMFIAYFLLIFFIVQCTYVSLSDHISLYVVQ